jgi:azurin
MKTSLGLILAGLLSTTSAFAKTCDVAVDASDAMTFNTKSIKATGCSEIKLTLKHTGKLPKAAMGHNLVIAAEADMKNVLADSTKAGPAKDYAPSTGFVAATKLLGGGESDTITFATSKFKKGTKYKFFCTFPGHSSVMVGDVAL